jgi:hypothetical protein
MVLREVNGLVEEVLCGLIRQTERVRCGHKLILTDM